MPASRQDLSAVLARLRVRLRRRVRAMSLLSQFMLAATIVIFVLMFTLGYWVNQRLERAVLESAGEFGAEYIQSFLSPHVQTITPQGELPGWAHQSLDSLFQSNRLHRNILSVKVWNREGRVIYSDRKPLIGTLDRNDTVARVFSGQTVTEYEHEHGHGTAIGDDSLVVEIYAPLYHYETDEVIAVGEFYEDARSLERRIHALKHSTWRIVGAMSVPMLGLLGLVVYRGSKRIDAQDDLLRRQLGEARRLAQQNARLRRTADNARMEATRTVETMLGRIGSDLHDGPVQLLSLFILRLSGRSMLARQKNVDAEELARNDSEIVGLASDVVAELRSVSSGLSLPELEHLALADVIRLAVSRHENITATEVETDLRLPSVPASHPLKICVYRIVQEALQNAAKHAGGRGQKVTASIDEAILRLVVSDRGKGFASVPAEAPEGAPLPHTDKQLGLRGMRSRTHAFGGELTIKSVPGMGTRVIARLPLQ